MAKVKIQGHASGTGILTVTAPNTSTDRTITLPDATGTLLNSDGDGSSLTGISSVGGATGVDFNDNVKARFGTGNDLQIYHDSNNSYIDDNGTGDFGIRSNGTKITLNRIADGHEGLKYILGGALSIKHNNSTKLETTATGVTVTGAVTADSSLIRGAVVQVQAVHLTPSGAITSAGGLSELSSSLRIAFTPKHASSKLKHEFFAPYNMPNSTHLQWAHFYDVTAGAIALGSASAGSRKSTHWGARTSDTDANDFDNLSMMIYQTAGSTTARTYTIWHGTEGHTASFGVSPLSSGSGATWPLVYTITEIYNP